ncbi:ABC transporter permease [Chloroflexi bacterium TSY]|nr:ABC transporter permease [Chloroflexi bacterium TSY]
MTRYILRRLLQAIPTLLGVSILSFILAYSAPGDPVTFRTFENPDITQEAKEILRKQLGLDQPVFVQYINWLTGIGLRAGNEVESLSNNDVQCSHWGLVNLTVCDNGGGILRGELGTSIDTKQPVWERLVERMPATLELGVASLLLAMLIGIPLGTLSAVYQGSIFDNITRFFTVVGQTVPDFWMGLMLIFFFGVVWRIFPTGGRSTVTLTGEVDLLDRLHHMVLPSFVLALGGIALFSRIMRTELLEVINTDYMRTAKAKGLSKEKVWMLHAFRNALVPLMTILGPAIFGVLGGAVVVERIFAWPGMGRLILDSVTQLDYPMVLGGTMVFAVFIILGNLLSDILYGVVDPRIHLS